MIENMYEQAIREFEIYFPGIAKDTVKCYPMGRHEILFVTKNNDQYIYYTMLHSVKKLRNVRDEDLSEEDWRVNFSMGLQFKMMSIGMTQRDLAERTGITTLSIHNYVTGKSLPSIYYAERIAEALGCSIAELTRFQ